MLQTKNFKRGDDLNPYNILNRVAYSFLKNPFILMRTPINYGALLLYPQFKELFDLIVFCRPINPHIFLLHKVKILLFQLGPLN